MLNTTIVQGKNGQTFTVTEPTIGQMIPFMRALREDSMAAMMSLMRLCVSENGVPLGDRLDSLPGSLFSDLSKAMTKVANLGGEEGNE